MKNELECNGGTEKSLIFTGDLNMPIINWDAKKISGGTRDLQRQAEELLEFAGDYYMDHFIMEPTRRENILDLFFTNSEETILKIEVEPPTLLSDHKLFIVTTSYLHEIPDLENVPDGESLRSLNFNDNQINCVDMNLKFGA